MAEQDRSENGLQTMFARAAKFVRKTNWTPTVIGIQIVSLVFLSFVAGTAVSYFRVFPYKYFRQAYMAGVAVYEDQYAYSGQYGQITGDPTKRPDQAQRSAASQALKRTTRHDPVAAYNGFTLFSGAQGQTQRPE